MLSAVRRLLARRLETPARGLSFQRPLVVLQSDDWGRVGVRDREGYELLRSQGIQLGEHAYDYYSLESAEDVIALRDVLKKHRDATGRPACLVMNFVLANVDFQQMSGDAPQKIAVLPLSQGLPGAWKRPGLFEAYRQGISDGVFHPALHGWTHFCAPAVERCLQEKSDRSRLLRTLWKAHTPYIYWRMPWVGYEYCIPEKPEAGFLDAQEQARLITQAAREFWRFFGAGPSSACAPGYRANADTHKAWFECGVRVAQNGSGAAFPPYMDERGMLNVQRTIDIEPAQRELSLEKYVQLAEGCFQRGVPAVVSVHAINFHSSLKDFRTPTLRLLDEFLSALESRHPDLLYVDDWNLYELATGGKFKGPRGAVSVVVRQQETAGPRSHARGAS